MQDKTILTISIICSLVGITSLLIASQFITEPSPDSESIKGTIESIQNYGETIKLRIKHQQYTSVLLFNSADINKELNIGQLIEVEGRISKDELIGEKVRILEAK